MINKMISIFVGILMGVIMYYVFKKKNSIILNYNFDISKEDKIRVNNKCFKSS